MNVTNFFLSAGFIMAKDLLSYPLSWVNVSKLESNPKISYIISLAVDIFVLGFKSTNSPSGIYFKIVADVTCLSEENL